MGLFDKIFGTHSEHELKRIYPIVDKIESMRDDMVALSDEELRAKTDEYKKRLAEGETLDDLLPEAYATVREAARRVLGMEHFRVQLIGGVILHQGRIAEMKTGEGKTLVSTLPAYLNALEGQGVHIVTVNDYLAKRDAEWMGKVHEFLGLTVGVVLNDIHAKSARRLTIATSHILPITNWDLIICVTTWLCSRNSSYSVDCIMPSSMRSIPYLLMRREHHLLFPDRATNQPSYMNCAICLQSS